MGAIRRACLLVAAWVALGAVALVLPPDGAAPGGMAAHAQGLSDLPIGATRPGRTLRAGPQPPSPPFGSRGRRPGRRPPVIVVPGPFGYPARREREVVVIRETPAERPDETPAPPPMAPAEPLRLRPGAPEPPPLRLSITLEATGEDTRAVAEALDGKRTRLGFALLREEPEACIVRTHGVEIERAGETVRGRVTLDIKAAPDTDGLRLLARLPEGLVASAREISGTTRMAGTARNGPVLKRPPAPVAPCR